MRMPVRGKWLLIPTRKRTLARMTVTRMYLSA